MLSAVGNFGPTAGPASGVLPYATHNRHHLAHHQHQQQQHQQHLQQFQQPHYALTASTVAPGATTIITNPMLFNAAQLQHLELQYQQQTTAATQLNYSALSPTAVPIKYAAAAAEQSTNQQQQQQQHYVAARSSTASSNHNNATQTKPAIMSLAEFLRPQQPKKHASISSSSNFAKEQQQMPMNLVTNNNNNNHAQQQQQHQHHNNSTGSSNNSSRPSSCSSVDVENDGSMSPVLGLNANCNKTELLAHKSMMVSDNMAAAAAAAYQLQYSHLYGRMPSNNMYANPVIISPSTATVLRPHASYLSAYNAPPTITAATEKDVKAYHYMKALQNGFQAAAAANSSLSPNSIMPKQQQQHQQQVNSKHCSSISGGTYLNDKVNTSPTSSSQDNSSDSFFKVPSGKEGSLKHRILTRPASSSNMEQQQNGMMKTHNSTSNFRKGSYIELANGQLRRVEDMRTEDFIQCAERSQHLRLEESTVVKIQQHEAAAIIISFSYDKHRSKADIEVMPDHPFFVYGQGWASCNPEKSLQIYGLNCRRLQVGDICISLIQREQSKQQQQLSLAAATAAADKKTAASLEQAAPRVMLKDQTSQQFSIAAHAPMPMNLPQSPHYADMFAAAANLAPKIMHMIYTPPPPPPPQQQQHQQHMPLNHAIFHNTAQHYEPTRLTHTAADIQESEAASSRKRRWSAPESSCDDETECQAAPPRRIPSGDGAQQTHKFMKITALSST